MIPKATEKYEHTWEAYGLKCEVVRHVISCSGAVAARLGGASLWWCGYVTLPKDHPWAADSDARHDESDVNGGINYEKAVDGGFKIGFDCHHAWDHCPDESGTLEIEQRYLPCSIDAPRTWLEADVRAEVERLASQAAGAALEKHGE